MFVTKEKVTRAKVQEAAMSMLQEGSLVYQNVEISLIIFNERKERLDIPGSTVSSARDVILDHVEVGRFEGTFLPFKHHEQTYYTSYEVRIN